MNVLEVRAVSKQYGSKKVLKDLSFSIPRGAIFGFVGENGAGKTTTMKLILGLDEMTSGEIYINGEKVRFGETATNRMTGYLPDVPEFYDYMTSTDYLMLCAEITQIPKNKRQARVAEMLSLVGLEQSKSKIKGFSRGMKQRLGIAQALLNEPEFLICDEPTSALDPSGRNEFLDLLASLKNRVTILFSTHILSDVERICDQVGILHKGSLQVVGEIDVLKERYAQPQIEIVFENTGEAEQFVEQTTQIIKEQHESQVFVSYSETYPLAFAELIAQLSQFNLTAKSIRHIAPSLEQIYLEVTK
ncbi:ABC transporter ATP-binding protein [Enterococcus alcedinis]|uniref:ABC transporter ATP-binding protein n=1 Tax=Enterococcus alcedinis TaxID=1274384 RepID=A0A917JHY2_9ENTE|nr:ABC transporter ATP-binding protein [Enterococcus alcedinis]MBP2102662.1 ABC-2 type transport system ATP-binding protein [Enterococcus alcedinis]GGI66222.1 ABC transporter ATP-binding protein [Enterococcus alcedinis]